MLFYDIFQENYASNKLDIRVIFNQIEMKAIFNPREATWRECYFSSGNSIRLPAA